MRKIIKKVMMTAILLCSASIVSAQQMQMPPVPVDPNVRIGKLENGLTYYIRHNELPQHQADYYIAQKVGSILEEENQRGLAHFLEHMCFNGTDHFPGKGIINYLETIGVKFGENLNAYTSIDETVYNISNVPTTREGIADSCLLILRDWADGLTLDPKEIDNERGVIHEEWRTRQSAMMRMYETVLPEIYPNSKYGHRLPIGLMSVVDNFPHQALRDYYEKWYRPDQQGIIVVGDIDVDQIEAKIKKTFSDIKMPENPAVREYFPVPDTNEPIISIGKDKEQQISQIMVMFKHDAPTRDEKNNMGYLLVEYMKSMVSTMLNDRLYELTQKAEPPYLGASSGDDDYIVSKTKQAFNIMSACKDDGIDTALATMMREVKRMKDFGFTASEYARAKANYLKNLEKAYNEREKTQTANYVNEYVRHFLDNEPIPGIENEYNIMNQIAPNIPVEAINQLIPMLVDDKNLVIALFMPEKEGIVYPTKEHILSVVNAVKAEKITAYEDKVSNEPLMKETPKGGKVVKTEDGKFGSKILTLSNGVRVIVKTTDFKADEISMKAFSPGGSNLYSEKEIINIDQINSLVSLGGIGNFSAVDLDKVLAGKNASVNASVNGLTEQLNGRCTPKDFETMMQLTYLTFTAPRMDQEAFESYKNRMKTQLKNMEGMPQKAFSDTIQVALYNHHPRVLNLTPEMVDQIDYNKVMEMYKDRFKDASDFTFMFVGNINLDEMKPLIETYLGGLPSINRKENYRDVNLNIRKGNYRNVFHRDQETPKATVIIVASGECKYTLENEVKMYMLSSLLDQSYLESVREKEGASYGVSVMGQISKYPEPKEDGILQIYFDTDPNKRAEMTKIVLDELDNFVKNGASEENLAKAKEFLHKEFKANQKQNSYWMNQLNEFYWYKVDMNTDYEKIVDSITMKDVQEFAKALFKQGNRIEVSMTTGDAN